MKRHRTHPLALALFLLGTAVLAGSRDETERTKAQVTSCSSLYGVDRDSAEVLTATGGERWWFLLVYCDRPNNVR
jgi:hypothetical protein